MYWIFEDGRIWSNFKQGRWMSTFKDRQGYLMVSLRKDGKGKILFLHRLLAINFIPNPENKPCVDHKDGIPTNNNLSNLRWVTKHENDLNRVNAVGVSFDKKCKTKPWWAHWYVGKKMKTKYFRTEEEALQHRKLMVDKYYNRPIIT